MKSIRKLASQFGLSRSALLYYDRRGLLKPEYRTSAGHRLYSERDEQRLTQICQLREAGLPLQDIEDVLEPNRAYRTPLAQALNRRLGELNREIAELRKQQQVVVALLRQGGATKRSRVMTKQRWVALLDAAGIDGEGRNRWHAEFEKSSPEAHQDFLESLGIEPAEIARIREESRRIRTVGS
jgi:DNA-binding transcriptional MerR regulator